MLIKFGHESLVLDSWCRKKQYDTMCSVLGSGMNFHLAENRLLREIFGLGEKISLLSGADLKQSKHDRVSIHSFHQFLRFAQEVLVKHEVRSTPHLASKLSTMIRYLEHNLQTFIS